MLGGVERWRWEDGKGVEFRTGCELVACGPVQVDTGMWVQSAEGTWAGDTAWGTHRQELWEAELEDMGI